MGIVQKTKLIKSDGKSKTKGGEEGRRTAKQGERQKADWEKMRGDWEKTETGAEDKGREMEWKKSLKEAAGNSTA